MQKKIEQLVIEHRFLFKRDDQLMQDVDKLFGIKIAEHQAENLFLWWLQQPEDFAIQVYLFI